MKYEISYNNYIDLILRSKDFKPVIRIDINDTKYKEISIIRKDGGISVHQLNKIKHNLDFGVRLKEFLDNEYELFKNRHTIQLKIYTTLYVQAYSFYQNNKGESTVFLHHEAIFPEAFGINKEYFLTIYRLKKLQLLKYVKSY